MIYNGKSDSTNDLSLEEQERARRMALTSNARSDRLVHDAIREDVIRAEERERERRLAEMGWLDEYARLEAKSDVSISQVISMEEEERRRRILDDEITDKIQKLGGLSKKQIIQAEEEERARRIKEDNSYAEAFQSSMSYAEVDKLEEGERQRRLAEDSFIDKINSRPSLSLTQVHQVEEAERSRRIQEDELIDSIRSRDSLSLDQIHNLEERERARRIAEDRIIDEVRSRPAMSWKDINDVEERERERRIYEDQVIDKVWSKSDLSKTEVIALEEKERMRRLQEDEMIDRQANSSSSRFQVIEMEEKERERRIAEDNLDLEKEKLRSKLDLVTARKLEEAERQRRISEDERTEALNEGSRRLAGAQVVALEELERSRRIAEDRHMDEDIHQQSLQNREWARLAEEEERRRRVEDLDRKKHSADYPLVHVVPAFVPELLNKLQPLDAGVTREIPAQTNLISQQPNLISQQANLISQEAPSFTVIQQTTEWNLPSSNAKRLIAVLGGTGAQGGAVIKSLLAEGKWSIRTLSRNSSSGEAKRLVQLGVEVLQGNVHNESDLIRLFSGAYGAYALTDAYDPQTAGKETQVGSQIARIARSAGVSHYIWSTLPNAEKISGGRYRVPHFTDKARVNAFIRQLGFQFYTFVIPSFYFQNFNNLFAPKHVDGKLEWTFPMEENAYLPAVDINDMGPVVAKILNNPEQYQNGKLRLAAENLKPQDYFINMSLVTKITTKVHLLNPYDYSKLYKLQPELVEMFAYFQDFGYFGKQDLASYNKANPLTSWAQFLSKERRQILESE